MSREFVFQTLFATRRRTTVVCVQLLGEDSLEPLTDLYLSVVDPDAPFEEDIFRLVEFDPGLGMLVFAPREKPLTMFVGDWLVYDGYDLVVVEKTVFEVRYSISWFRNRRKRVRRKRKIDKLKELVEGTAGRKSEDYDFWEFSGGDADFPFEGDE